MASNEALKTKTVPEIHFKPEGYLSGGEAEFLDQLLEILKKEGFSPDELVFSGFDGREVAKGLPMPRHLSIFVMNEAGWRNALKYKETNPAQYAESWGTPCIGLYAKDQLTLVYSATMDIENKDDRVELGDVKLGSPLAEMAPNDPIEEAIVHKDYPDGSPTDALLGLVFID